MNKLSCKPAEAGIIFSKYSSELNGQLSLRSLDLDNDAAMLINWVNQPYSKKYWQMDGSEDNWRATYAAIMRDEATHAFIGCFDQEPICQIDAYLISASELNDHVKANNNDAGLHLLMGPPREMQKGFAWYALKCFQQYFFSFDHAGDLYAEPDQHNYHANRLAINTGFTFMRTIQLASKSANLYRITRAQFSN